MYLNKKLIATKINFEQELENFSNLFKSIMQNDRDFEIDEFERATFTIYERTMDLFNPANSPTVGFPFFYILNRNIIVRQGRQDQEERENTRNQGQRSLNIWWPKRFCEYVLIFLWLNIFFWLYILILLHRSYVYTGVRFDINPYKLDKHDNKVSMEYYNENRQWTTKENFIRKMKNLETIHVTHSESSKREKNEEEMVNHFVRKLKKKKDRSFIRHRRQEEFKDAPPVMEERRTMRNEISRTSHEITVDKTHSYQAHLGLREAIELENIAYYCSYEENYKRKIYEGMIKDIKKPWFRYKENFIANQESICDERREDCVLGEEAKIPYDEVIVSPYEEDFNGVVHMWIEKKNNGTAKEKELENLNRNVDDSNEEDAEKSRNGPVNRFYDNVPRIHLQHSFLDSRCHLYFDDPRRRYNSSPDLTEDEEIKDMSMRLYIEQKLEEGPKVNIKKSTLWSRNNSLLDNEESYPETPFPLPILGQEELMLIRVIYPPNIFQKSINFLKLDAASVDTNDKGIKEVELERKLNSKETAEKNHPNISSEVSEDGVSTESKSIFKNNAFGVISPTTIQDNSLWTFISSLNLPSPVSFPTFYSTSQYNSNINKERLLLEQKSSIKSVLANLFSEISTVASQTQRFHSTTTSNNTSSRSTNASETVDYKTDSSNIQENKKPSTPSTAIEDILSNTQSTQENSVEGNTLSPLITSSNYIFTLNPALLHSVLPTYFASSSLSDGDSSMRSEEAVNKFIERGSRIVYVDIDLECLFNAASLKLNSLNEPNPCFFSPYDASTNEKQETNMQAALNGRISTNRNIERQSLSWLTHLALLTNSMDTIVSNLLISIFHEHRQKINLIHKIRRRESEPPPQDGDFSTINTNEDRISSSILNSNATVSSRRQLDLREASKERTIVNKTENVDLKFNYIHSFYDHNNDRNDFGTIKGENGIEKTKTKSGMYGGTLFQPEEYYMFKSESFETWYWTAEHTAKYLASTWNSNSSLQDLSSSSVSGITFFWKRFIFKFTILFHALFCFFILSTQTAFLVRLLLALGVLIFFPVLSLIKAFQNGVAFIDSCFHMVNRWLQAFRSQAFLGRRTSLRNIRNLQQRVNSTANENLNLNAIEMRAISNQVNRDIGLDSNVRLLLLAYPWVGLPLAQHFGIDRRERIERSIARRMSNSLSLRESGNERNLGEETEEEQTQQNSSEDIDFSDERPLLNSTRISPHIDPINNRSTTDGSAGNSISIPFLTYVCGCHISIPSFVSRCFQRRTSQTQLDQESNRQNMESENRSQRSESSSIFSIFSWSSWYIAANLILLSILYLGYEGMQLIVSYVLYFQIKPIPGGLDIGITGLVLLWEYFAMLFLRSYKGIYFFPRACLAIFFLFHFYHSCFLYPFSGLALFICYLISAALMISTFLYMEVPSFYGQEVNTRQTRAVYNLIPFFSFFSSQNDAVDQGADRVPHLLPPWYSLFFPLNTVGNRLLSSTRREQEEVEMDDIHTEEVSLNGDSSHASITRNNNNDTNSINSSFFNRFRFNFSWIARSHSPSYTSLPRDDATEIPDNNSEVREEAITTSSASLPTSSRSNTRIVSRERSLNALLSSSENSHYGVDSDSGNRESERHRNAFVRQSRSQDRRKQGKGQKSIYDRIPKASELRDKERERKKKQERATDKATDQHVLTAGSYESSSDEREVELVSSRRLHYLNRK